MGAHPIVGGALVVPSLVSGHALQQDGVPALAQISSPGSRALHQYNISHSCCPNGRPCFLHLLPIIIHSSFYCLLYCALLPFFSGIWWVYRVARSPTLQGNGSNTVLYCTVTFFLQDMVGFGLPVARHSRVMVEPLRTT